MEPKVPGTIRHDPSSTGDDTAPPSAAFQTGDWSADLISQTPPAPEEKWPRPFGVYELLGEVARGGMGVVYKARQRGLDRVVALKMVLGAEIGRKGDVERFLVEARAAAALDHPNVVPVHDAGEIDGRVYFTMAYIDGSDLRGYVHKRGIPAVADAVMLFAPVVAGVAHAHRHGIIHRDLKPANVLIDRDGRPRVTDFGLAKRASADAQLTGNGQILGTPAYMAPEQARDSKEAGPPADVYGLGGIFYYLLTGRAPFEADSVPSLLVKVVTENPTPPRQINPAVPPAVEALCLRCLAKNPADRPADAQALYDELMPLAEELMPRSAGRLSGASGWSGSRVTAPVPDEASETLTFSTAPRKPGRRAVWIGVGAFALTAAALFAARPWLKPTDPTPPPGQGPQPQPAAASGGKGGGTDELVLPPPTRADFKVTIDVIGNKSQDPAGVLLIPERPSLQLVLQAERNCSVMVYTIDPDGKQLCLFPNKYDTNGTLTAGQPLVIPRDSSYTLKLSPTAIGGTEKLRVMATTGVMMPLVSGERAGAFTAYNSDADRRALVASVKRGITVVGNDGDAPPATKVEESDFEFPYRIVRR